MTTADAFANDWPTWLTRWRCPTCGEPLVSPRARGAGPWTWCPQLHEWRLSELRPQAPVAAQLPLESEDAE